MSKQIKAWYKSKTIWIGLAEICTAIGAYFGGEIEVETLVTLLLSGISMIALRIITKTPVKLI